MAAVGLKATSLPSTFPEHFRVPESVFALKGTTGLPSDQAVVLPVNKPFNSASETFRGGVGFVDDDRHAVQRVGFAGETRRFSASFSSRERKASVTSPASSDFAPRADPPPGG